MSDETIEGEGKILKTCHWDGMGNAEYACHHEFYTKSGTSKYCPCKHYAECKYCHRKFAVSSAKKPGAYCSRSCQQKARQLAEHGGSDAYKKCQLPGCDNPISSRNASTCCHEHAAKLRALSTDKNSKNENLIECEWPYCHHMFKPSRSTQIFCMEDDHYAVCKAVINGEECGKKIRVARKGLNLNRIPISCCSSHASVLSHTPESKKKREENSMKKWGTKTPLQAKEVKDKIKKSLDEHPDRDTRFGGERFKKNLVDKFGVDNASKSEAIKIKKKATLREHYDVDNPMYSPEIRERQKNTMISRYGVSRAFEMEEVQETIRKKNLEKYGVEYPLQSEEYRKTVVEAANLSKYGTPYPLQSEAGRQHMRESCMSKYGYDWTSKVPEIRSKQLESLRKNYDAPDVINAFQIPEIKEKSLETIRKKYGLDVDNVSQVPEVSKRMRVSLSKTLEEKVRNGDLSVSQISKKNREFAEILEILIPGVKIEFEKQLSKIHGGNVDFYITSPNGERSVLVDLNPTISHNSLKSYWCIITGCKPNGGKPHKHGKPTPVDYAYKRAVEATEEWPDVNYLQFWDWDGEDYAVRCIKRELGMLDHLSVGDYSIESFGEDDVVEYAVRHDGRLVASSVFVEDEDGSWTWSGVKRTSVMVDGVESRVLDEFMSKHDGVSVTTILDYGKNTMKHTVLGDLGFVELMPSGPVQVFSREDEVEESADNRDDMDGLSKDGWLPVGLPGYRVFRRF